MTEEIGTEIENEVNTELTEPSGPRFAYLLPALILSVLVAVVVGGYFLYQSSGGNLLLSASRPARIAFMSDREDNWEIYIMDRDGSNLLNLTSNPSADGIPILVPGQDELVFASDRDGPGLDLFLVDLEGSNVTNITQSADSNEIPLAWSPDGENLVFISDQNGPAEIFSMRASDSELLNLSERDKAQSFDDWSSKTDRFVLTSASDTGMSLFVTDLAGDTPQPLTNGSYPAGGGRWSPDGEKVAFMAIGPESLAIDVFVIDIAGGEPINLTQSPSNDRFPQWSPDGSKIAFVSDRDGNSEIYVMDADGSNPTNLTNDPADDSIQGDFDWSPDGAQILFHTSRDDNIEVYVMDADGNNQANLSNSQGTDAGAIWVE